MCAESQHQRQEKVHEKAKLQGNKDTYSGWQLNEMEMGRANKMIRRRKIRQKIGNVVMSDTGGKK